MRSPFDATPAALAAASIVMACSVIASGAMASGCVGGRLAAFGVPSVSGDGIGIEDEALEALRRGATADDYAALAAVRFARDETRAARAHAGRALALEPEHVGATVLLAQLEAREQHLAAATTLYRRAALLAPRVRPAIARMWSEALLALAEQRLERREGERALLALAELEEGLPERAEAARSRRATIILAAVELWLELGATEPVADALARARSAGGDAGEIAFAEARVLALRPETAELGRERLTGWASRLDQGRRWRRVAEFHGRHGGAEDAERAWRQAAVHAPDDPVPLLRAAELARRAGSLDTAVATWLEAAQRTAGREGPRAAADALLAAAAQLTPADSDTAVARAAVILEDAALAHAPRDGEVVEAVASQRGHRGDAAGAAAVLVAWVEAGDRAPEEAVRAARFALALGLPEIAVALVEPLAGPEASAELLVVLGLAAGRGWRGAAGGRPDGSTPLGEREWSRQLMTDALTRAEALALAAAGAERGDVEGLAAVGAAWLELGEVAQARRIADELKRRAPDRAAGPLLAASAAEARRRGAARGAELDAFMASVGEDPGAALAVGRWFASRGERVRASRWLELAAAAVQPEISVAAHEALFHLHAADRPEDARRHLRAWVALAGDRAPELLEALRGLPLRSAALRRDVLDALARVRPDDGQLLGEIGLLLFAEGRHVEAERSFRRQVTLAEDPATLIEAIVATAKAHRREDIAARFAAQLPPSRVEDPALLAAAGHVHAARGDEALARHFYASYLSHAADGRRVGAAELQGLGERLRDTGRLDLAVQAFLVALARNPTSSKAVQGLAQTWLRRGDVGRAKEILGRYADANPRTRRQLLEEVARVLAREGHLRAAAEVYEQRLGLDVAPNVEVFSLLVDLYRRLGDRAALAEAAAVFVDRSTPAGAQRFFEVAHARLREAGAFEDADRVLAIGVARSGRDRRLLLLDLQAAVRARDPARAYEAAERLAKLQAGAAAAWAGLAAQLIHGALAAEAELLLDSAIARHPADPALFLARATARLALGRADDAHHDFIEALTRALSSTEVLEVAEKVYRPALQHERLRDLRARAVALAPGRSDHLVALAGSLLDAGRVEEARQALSGHLAVNDRAEIAVALALHGAGHLEAALEHYLRALDQVSTADVALTRIGQILRERGDAGRVDEAVRLYLMGGAGRRVDPGLVGEVMLAVGRRDDALVWLERAASEQPAERGALELASLRDALGDEAGALDAMHRALVSARSGDAQAGPAMALARQQAFALLAAGRVGAAAGLARRMSRETREPWARLLDAQVALLGRGVTSGAEGFSLTGHETERAALGPIVLELTAELVARGHADVALELLDRALEPGPNNELEVARLGIAAAVGDLDLADAAGGALAVRASWPATALAYRVAGYPERAHGRLTGALALAAATPALLAELAALEQAHPWLAPAAEGRAALDGEDVLERVWSEALVAVALRDDARALAAAESGLAFAPGHTELLEIALVSAARRGDGASLERLRAHAIAAYGDPGRAHGLLREAADGVNDPVLALRVVEVRLGDALGDGALRLEALDLALAAGDLSAVQRHAGAFLGGVGEGPLAHLALAERFATWLYLDLADDALAAAAGAEPTGVGEGSAPARAPGPLEARRRLLAARVAVLAGDDARAAAMCAEHVAASDDEVLARQACAGEVHRLGGRPGLVLELLEPIAAPGSEVALRLTALAAWRHGDHGRARAAARALGERFHPTEPEAMLAEAVRAGDADGAAQLLEWFSRARVAVARLADSASRALEERALAPGGLGPRRLDEALIDVVTGLVATAAALEAPGEPAIAASWSRVALSSGDVAGAERALEDALFRRPWSASAASALAWFITERVGDLPRALRLAGTVAQRGREPDARPGRRGQGLRQARDKHAESERPWMEAAALRGWILHRQGRSAEGLALLRGARARAGNDPATVGQLLSREAEILASLGRMDEAVASWRGCAIRLGATEEGLVCRRGALRRR